MSQAVFRNWRRILPLVLGAALFAMGIYALHHLLGPVDPAEIMARVRTTPLATLIAAVAATAVGYAALVAYDFFAMRFIGRRLPFGVVALGGFLGYAFGNTIGVSVISGGAVRYRIYSAAGLNAFEVATVSGYVAMALGAGLSLIGLVALAVYPGAVSAYLPYSEGSVRLIAGAAAIVSVAAILWVSIGRRRLSFRGFELRLPPPGDLAGQLVATLIDVAAAAFALWILLPEGRPDFGTLVAVYAAATMIGVMSHVPGGVGVFELVVIGVMPASVPVGDAAAALLLFRMIYYLLPFALGFLIVALNEARAAGGLIARLMGRLPAPVQPALATLHGLAPSLVAAVAFGFGAYLLLVTMIPDMRSDALADGDLTAALLREGGTLATAGAGLMLLILSHGLLRRVSSALSLALAMLAAGAAASLLNHFDIESAGVLALGALSLLPFRRAFTRKGALTEGPFSARWFALVIAVVLATGAFFFFAHKAAPYPGDVLTGFAGPSNTPQALRSGLLVSGLLFLFCLHLLIRPARRAPPEETGPEALARAARIAARAENPQAWLSQAGDKRLLFAETGDAFIMYGVRGGSWVALGDPVGEPAAFEGLCWSFAELADAANCRPVFHEIGARHLPLWAEQGYSVQMIGEEAVVKLKDFSLSDARFRSMRAAFEMCEREGHALEILGPPHAPALIGRLAAISAAWLDSESGAAKGFSVGPFDPGYLAHFEIAVVRKDGEIVAFANIMTAGGAVAVDLMRYLPGEAIRVMEFMFLRLIEHYRDRGAAEFSLGAAPLAGLSQRAVGRSWRGFGRMIYRQGGAFHDFEGLRAFKQKFQPEWRPRYVALSPRRSPLLAMNDIALLIAGASRGPIRK
ncbi:MAG: bifunctional lysylphosphatidylglycerol flippase/synthetase MprF [Pikeienuella sp.]